MKIIDEMADLARTWPEQLRERQAKGQKLVGYTGRFVPEELIRAAGAIPHYLCRGGEPEPPEAVLPYMLRFMDPFSRAQIGYHLMDIDPVMPLLDLIVAQCEDCHMTRLADMLEYFKLPTLKLGVPPDWDKGIARDYYFKRLVMLRSELEKLTGNIITPERLSWAIETMNCIRQLLGDIGRFRRQASPPISGSDVIRLHHLSFQMEDTQLLPRLESIRSELAAGLASDLTSGPAAAGATGPRILMAGNVIAAGDYVVPDMIEEFGGIIVAEFMDRGHRYIDWEVAADGDPMANLCATYYLQRVPPTVFQPAWQERLDYLKQQLADFKVDAVVWYQLAFDEIHNLECAVVAKELGKMGVPFLKLESAYEYTREATGALATRVESFIASIDEKGGR